MRRISNFKFVGLNVFFSKVAMAIFLLTILSFSVFAQDDDEVEFSGKVMDAANRQIGKADFIQDGGADVKIMFGYYLKMWLDGNRLRIINPESGSRSTTINCYFREYKVDASSPNDSSRWKSTGSGTATLQMPPEGEVQKINGSMKLTKKVVGNDEAEVNETSQKFLIVIE